MKQDWLFFRVFCVCAWFASGCGEESVDALDPSTFSGMNEDTIRFDCRNTIECSAQRGEELPPNPIESCVQHTARHLEARPDTRSQYLSNVARCQGFVVCDYNECALNDMLAGYGQMQIDKITHDCQQDVECRRQLGMTVGDPTTELNSCIANNVGLLDAFNPGQRSLYESTFTSCMGRLACDFTNCFQF